MLRKIISKVSKSKREKVKFFFKKNKYRNSLKIFCVGYNKTGTTSLAKAMQDLGYEVGDQRKAELMHHDWAKRDFNPLIRYCKTADFFQDFPFSKAYTFVALDQAFPDSKFILTIRDNPEQWYNSLIKFHTKLWSTNGLPPTVYDLKNANYVYKGWAWEINRYSSITPIDKPYDKKSLIDSYVDHNNNVINYFKHKSDKLLILNVSDKDAYHKLCRFLNKPISNNDFPWENKT